jgi:hypothetical protein
LDPCGFLTEQAEQLLILFLMQALKMKHNKRCKNVMKTLETPNCLNRFYQNFTPAALACQQLYETISDIGINVAIHLSNLSSIWTNLNIRQ